MPLNYTSSYYNSGDVSSTIYDVTTIYDVSTITANMTCIQNSNLFTIAFIPFKLVVTFLNVLLFAAAAIDSEKLQRMNYRFYCVRSTLLSNTMYLLMSIWLTVDNYSQSETNVQENIMSAAKYIWIFSEAFAVSMVLCICANVTSLIYVTLDSVFYVGRTGTEWGGKDGKEENAKLSKERTTRSLVIACWVFPCLLTAITFGWNCAKQCHCPSNNFIGEHCPDEQRCSHMWAPLKIDFLFLVIIIWAAEVVGLVVFLIKGIRRHRRSVEIPVTSADRTQFEFDDTSDVRTMTSPPREHDTSGHRTRRKSVFKRKLNSKFRFATILTVVLVICTSPAIVATLADSFIDNPPYGAFTLMSGIFLFLYCALCPILLWKYFPTLRSSTIKLLLCLKNCSCVTSREKKPTLSVSSP